MINLRYHIVSLTAVFLALAIGVAVGTSFINRATVDQLKRQIRRAEKGIDQTSQNNKALQAQLDQDRRGDDALEVDAAARGAGSVSLADLPVLIVAADGVDRAQLDRVRSVLAAAGADLRGTLTLNASLGVQGGLSDDLSAAVGLPPKTPRPDAQRAAVRSVGRELDDAATRKLGSASGAPALLQRLLAAGFLGYQAPADSTLDATSVLAGGGYRYVFVSEPDVKVPDEDFFLPVLRVLATDGSAPVVVASAALGDDPEGTRVEVVGPIRNDQQLHDAVSTVDDLERYEGLVAVVEAMADLDSDGPHGHYGFGDGADAILPAPA